MFNRRGGGHSGIPKQLPGRTTRGSASGPNQTRGVEQRRWWMVEEIFTRRCYAKKEGPEAEPPKKKSASKKRDGTGKKLHIAN